MNFHPHHHERTIAFLSPVVESPQVHKTTDERTGINGWLGLHITKAVGTMWCAYVFGLIALVSLPTVLATGSLVVIVAWVAQTFLQLVLLSVIIVGQNISQAASDKRAESTFKDAEAVLHEALEIQRHLAAQDTLLSSLHGKIDAVAPSVPSSSSERATQVDATNAEEADG